MCHDHRCRVVSKRMLGHHARVHTCSVYRALEQFLVADYPVPGIQEYALKYFPAPPLQASLQIVQCICRAGQGSSTLQAVARMPGKSPTADLKHFNPLMIGILPGGQAVLHCADQPPQACVPRQALTSLQVCLIAGQLKCKKRRKQIMVGHGCRISELFAVMMCTIFFTCCLF